MAVVLQHLCDHPTHGEKQVPGRPQPGLFVPGSKKPMVVDLCEDHAGQLVQPLVDLFSEHGRVVDLTEAAPRRAPATNGAEAKEVCGYRGCKEKFRPGQPMSGHRRRTHGIGPKKG